jgi:Chromo (CHRromatin Organisation MOdifier) domain
MCVVSEINLFVDKAIFQLLSRKDYLEFFSETILQHTGDVKRLSTLQFKVKWLGYDETYNWWEPWANFKEMEILHHYLSEKNIRQIISKQIKETFCQISYCPFVFIGKKKLWSFFFSFLSWFFDYAQKFHQK